MIRHRFEAILGLSVIIIVIFWLKREKNLPPGPIGLPILGYLPFLGKEAYRTLHTFTGKYGPVFSFYLGRNLVVVLGNFKTVKEALSNNNIMDRPKNPPNHLLPDSTNLSVSNGVEWKEQRQFSIQTFRQLGMGKSRMEEIIHTELNRLTKEIDSKQDKPFNLDEILLPSVSNAILSMLTGSALDFRDEKRVFLNRILSTMTVFFRPTRIHAYFPSIRKWLARFKIWGYDQAEIYMDKFSKFITEEIEYHKKENSQLDVENYIHAYLNASKSATSISSFSDRMLKGNFQSLFSAGSTPSRATIEWSLLSMIQKPDVQQMVQRELDSVLGTGTERLLTWADHVQLPYTMSVLYEVMRQNTIVPIAMLRCSSKRTQISGYNIPKGTVVMPNIWGVHHNTEDWEDPFTFKPERFLKDGKLSKPQAFIPFSYGKRNCLGEDMAIIHVFLYFATLLHRYSIALPSEDGDFPQILGVAKLIILDNVCMKKRF
ncbi:hypothetical protein JTE90_001633 [Oedothorax gibbosus]|uniref:Cytochrome P450 n=1 Tax=Oedothorax gibbosus TaxID=931172 RepID=A0AAV6VPA3_9ARAC|nr:hypothetical protein JTE90_001633 [Oedothorax gibbosus]